jgi:archaellum component FlaF (FlaF/FlaG flagellin family)
MAAYSECFTEVEAAGATYIEEMYKQRAQVSVQIANNRFHNSKKTAEIFL